MGIISGIFPPRSQGGSCLLNTFMRAASLRTHSGPEHGLCVGGGGSQEQQQPQPEAAKDVGSTGPRQLVASTWCLALSNGFRRHIQAPVPLLTTPRRDPS